MMMTMIMIMNCFCSMATDQRCLALLPVGNIAIIIDPHHRESPTRHEQGLNLRRTCVQGLVEWSCAIVITAVSGESHFLEKMVQNKVFSHIRLMIKFWNSSLTFQHMPSIHIFNTVINVCVLEWHHLNVFVIFALFQPKGCK